MKFYVTFWVVMLSGTLHFLAQAHLEPQAMLFYTSKKMKEAQRTVINDRASVPIHSSVYYEQRDAGGLSKVVTIGGLHAFKQAVLMGSFARPVVLKVYAAQSKESGEVKPHFQDVADQFDQKVSCVAINLLDHGTENRAIVAHLLAKCGIHRVDLPLFLFFKNGQLQLPVRQGFHTKENLALLITQQFFSECKNNEHTLKKVSNRIIHDVTPTQVGK